jgi:four helix bundle protein
MPRYERFRVWHMAREVVREVQLTAAEFGDCGGGLANQLRRAAISIASNIAEGSEKTSDAELRRFFAIARGSCAEATAQVTIAYDMGLVSEQRYTALSDRLDHVGRMLSAFITRLESG